MLTFLEILACLKINSFCGGSFLSKYLIAMTNKITKLKVAIYRIAQNIFSEDFLTFKELATLYIL
jgi:hypothetical protein